MQKRIKLSQIVMVYGCNIYHIMDAVRDGELHHENFFFDKTEVENWVKGKVSKATGGRF